MWRAGLSQSELAPKWGMTQASLSLKLRGKRPWFATEINSAAAHFRVSRDALFTKLPDVDSNHEPAGIKPAAKIRAVARLSDRRRPRPTIERMHPARVAVLRHA